MVFDEIGNLVGRYNTEHKQYYPRPGWVEHDAEEIYKNTLFSIKQLIKSIQLDTKDIVALSLTNQRETAVIWDRKTGKPVYNAIVWQCQRGEDLCQSLRNEGLESIVSNKTGLVLDSYFSASKLRWIIDNVDGVEDKARNGELALGTIDSFLIYKLTNGKVHATDYSNACRTMLFNIFDLKWDEDLEKLFNIPKSMFPEVRLSDSNFGNTDCNGILDSKIPITGVLGDSHAALFGQNCFSTGLGKATYGTGSSVMLNIGSKPLLSSNGIVTSIGWADSNSVKYVFEGNVHCTGDTIRWLVNDLELIDSPLETEKLALSIENNNGVYMVPAFAGLGAPYWNSYARAVICGMARNTKKAHVVRAALEAIAYQIKDLLEVMLIESSCDFKELRVDGGPTNNGFLMQFQADMLDVPIVKSNIEEVSALGTVYMAGLNIGIWNSVNEIEECRKIDRVFNSSIDSELRELYYSGWKGAVKTVLDKSVLDGRL